MGVEGVRGYGSHYGNFCIYAHLQKVVSPVTKKANFSAEREYECHILEEKTQNVYFFGR